MNRRNFLEIIPQAGLAVLLPSIHSCSSITKNANKKFEYYNLNIKKHNSIALPEGKRVPFNWPATGIDPGESITVKVNEKLPQSTVWLRVSVAQDNRGGIELQQSDYRVIAQMGMGLMAQLYAYL